MATGVSRLSDSLDKKVDVDRDHNSQMRSAIGELHSVILSLKTQQEAWMGRPAEWQAATQELRSAAHEIRKIAKETENRQAAASLGLKETK